MVAILICFVIPGLTLICRVEAEGTELDVAALRAALEAGDVRSRDRVVLMASRAHADEASTGSRFVEELGVKWSPVPDPSLAEPISVREATAVRPEPFASREEAGAWLEGLRADDSAMTDELERGLLAERADDDDAVVGHVNLLNPGSSSATIQSATCSTGVSGCSHIQWAAPS